MSSAIKYPFWKCYGAALTAALTGVLATFILFIWIRHYEFDRLERKFKLDAFFVSSIIESKLKEHLVVLDTVRNFYVTSKSLTKDDFVKFIISELQDNPGIKAVEWIPKVSNAERAIFEKLNSNGGAFPFEIKELSGDRSLVKAGDRDFYFPIQLVTPLQGNKLTLGFDVSSETVRRTAMGEAADTGLAIATRRIRLIQEREQQYGFMVFLPVYYDKMQHDNAERRRVALRGFIAGIFRSGDIIKASPASVWPQHLVIQLQDITVPPPENLFTIHAGAAGIKTSVSDKLPANATSLSNKHKFNFSSRTWCVNIFADRDYIDKNLSSFYLLILPAGLLLTLLLSALLFSFVREILRHKQTEKELLDAKQEADNANMAKSHFLSNMSHEIRTPMNGIVGMTELLIESNLDDEQNKYARMIRDSANSLISIINDILDISKIEAGKLQLEMLDFELRKNVIEVVELMSLRAQGKSLKLNCSIEQDIPMRAVGDPVRLKQILINLIGNAIKFTQRGKITLHIKTESKDENGAMVRFEVRDTGIGIAPDRILALFKPFTQGDSSVSRKFGGTGLGLAISRQLVEMMGGKIGAESEPDSGSTFWFTLRLGFSNIHENSADNNEKSILSKTGTVNKDGCILVVEDNMINQQMTVEVLHRLGYKADAASSGPDALAVMSKKHYDLVLMDIQLSEMNGFEVTGAIRNPISAVLDHNVPVIAMTAYVFQGDREKCLAAGMQDYLAKPISFKKFAEVIEKWISRPEAPELTAAEPREHRQDTLL